METMLRFFVDNPLIAAFIALSAGFFLYFILKKVLKYALISLAVFLALSVFSYYRAPDEFPDRIRSNIEEIRDRGEDLVDRGKDALEQGKRGADRLDRFAEKWREWFPEKNE